MARLGFYGSARLRAMRFFHEQTAGVLDSVGSLTTALDLVGSHSPYRDASRAARELERMVRSGMSIADAMRLLPDLFSADQVRLVEAADRSGELPACLRRIARRLEAIERVRRDTARSLAYPVLLVHGVLVIFPIGTLISGGVDAYLASVLRNLLIAWVLAAGVAVLVARLGWRRTLGRIPGLAGIVSTLRAGNFCFALGSLYETGVPVVQAVEAAVPAGARGDTGVEAALAELRDGSDLARFLERSGIVPFETHRVVRVAEPAGNTGEALLGEARRLEELALDRMRRAAFLASRGIYIAAVIAAAATIIRFYAGYYSLLGS